MVPVFWSKLLAGEGEAPRCLSRYLRSRVVYSSDACKVFLGFDQSLVVVSLIFWR